MTRTEGRWTAGIGLLVLVAAFLLIPLEHLVRADHTGRLTLQSVQDHVDDLEAALAVIPPVPVNCPCEGLTVSTAVWDDVFSTDYCTDTTSVLPAPPGIRTVTVGNTPTGDILILTNQSGQPPYTDDPHCFVRGNFRVGSIHDLSPAQYDECISSLYAIAAADGVACTN